MDAIRNSSNKERTLESFWKGQIKSKLWIIDELSKFVNSPVSIDIHGGWNGVLASLFFQSNIPIKNITSLDIDPACEETSRTINKIEEMQGTFQTITADMCSYKSQADIIVNTSCEHLTQQQYDQWVSNIDKRQLIVIQSNNYVIEEHIRICHNLEEFKKQSNIQSLWAGELDLPLYKRFMIIGYPNV